MTNESNNQAHRSGEEHQSPPLPTRTAFRPYSEKVPWQLLEVVLVDASARE